MKSFHPLSFALGLGSGLLVLVLFVGTMRMMTGGQRGRLDAQNGGNFRQFGGNGGPNTARMAQRLGMTEAELQAEIDGGKTMQQIAQEHGVTFPMGGRMRGSASSAPSSAGATSSALSS